MDTDDLYASFQIYQHASDIGDFRYWLKETHNLEDQDSIFLGYRYFLEVSSLLLLDEFSDDESLRIKDDEIYRAAQQRGLRLYEIPNSCNRVVFLKNIWNYFKLIRDAQNWEELQGVLRKIQDITIIFEKIFEKLEVEEDISKETACRFFSLYYTHHRLNDTRMGKPIAANGGPIKPSIDYPGIDVFKGYAYTLEYIWFVFLGKNAFNNSIARFIHDPQQAMIAQDNQDLENIGSLSQDEDLEKQQSIIAWDSLDDLFHPLFDQNLKNIWVEHKLPPRRIFVFREEYDRGLIRPLLDRSTIEEPAYLSDNTSEEEIFKKLNYQFRWLDIAVVSADHENDSFGTFAFIPFLLGLTTSKNVSPENKISILRIRHYEEGIKGFVYSYAILNEGFFFDDYGMGWLIFLTVGNEISGHGGSMYREVEDYIKKYDNAKILNVREFDIDEQVFKKYIRTNTSFFFEDDEVPIETLLSFREDQNIEFKSSLIWSHIKNRRSDSAENEVMRSIASFLNTDGGTLVIGVDDEGKILGLEKDYSQLGSPRSRNSDGFERYLFDKIDTKFGKTNSYYVKAKCEPVGGEEICRVSIIPSDDPVFLKNNNESEFIIRSGSASKKLTTQEFYAYIQKHWRVRKMRT
jgi:hypothetical protein